MKQTNIIKEYEFSKKEFEKLLKTNYAIQGSLSNIFCLGDKVWIKMED